MRPRPAPVVATNDVRFLARDEFEAHEARVCIHGGHRLDDPGRPRPYTPEQYLKTPDEMAALFRDLPEALENSVEIARRCSLPLAQGGHFPARVRRAGRHERAGLPAPARDRRARTPGRRRARARPTRYHARLEQELGVICGMGFEGYFLVVADFIRWAREREIPVGPGRGSGAGSLVAWVLGITDLDPIRHDLLFERFLNPERVSMPDFDIDFCMSRRDQVIEYVADRYGRDRVSQIITFGSLAARAVVRDVGRVLGLPYGFVDGVAKLIPFELGITLEDALEKEPELARRYGAEDEVRDLVDLAKRLEGLARNAGTHAGGVVIAPSPLTDFTALYCEAGGRSVVTQFDKDDVEQVGLVKFDFLGPAHAHDHRLGGAPHQREAARRGRGAARPRAAAARRRGDVQAAEVGAHDGDLPARVARHHRPRAQAPARPLRRHRRARRAVPSGPAAVRHGGRLHRPQARPRRRRRSTTCTRASPRS